MLWSAQGAGTGEIFAWLLESGSDFSLVNSNGHSALHKAAQRGSSGAIKWLVDTFLFNSNFNHYLFIGPDTEGNCPSDLCGMEGHENLAIWIAKHECDCIIRAVKSATSGADYLKLSSDSNVPLWLKENLHEAHCSKSTGIDSIRTCWGSGYGVRRMSLGLIEHSSHSSLDEAEKRPVDNDFNDID